jgi:hypothetical protein
MAWSHFYGTVKGKSTTGEASRSSTKEDGLRVVAASKQGAIEVWLSHDREGRDRFSIEMKQHASSEGWEGTIARGTMGVRPVKDMANENVILIATYTSYIVEGINDKIGTVDEKTAERLSDKMGGHIAMSGYAAKLALQVFDRMQEAQEQDFPGVFEYEVLSPLGGWVYTNQFPELEVVMGHFEMELAKWFTQGANA